jgi:hypothetical protein
MIYARFIAERRSLASAAIRLRTDGWPSHVEFIKEIDGSVVDVLASRWPHGVQHYGYITRGVTREEWYTAPGIICAWNAMQHIVGHRYGLLDILAIGTGADWHDDGRYISSEAVAFAFEQAHAPLLNPKFPVRSIAPRDLLLSQQLTLVSRVR